MIRPSDWIWTSVCVAAGLIVGLFAIKFVKVITILATAVFGGTISGTALYYLLPLKWEWFHILLCVVLSVLGVLAQILFVSGRRKRQMCIRDSGGSALFVPGKGKFGLA